MIPLKVHNILDYVGAGTMLLAPSLFGFDMIASARNTFWVLGGALLIYSLFTQYYYSLAKVIPVKVHMGLDVTVAVVLMLAPWIFGYRQFITDGQLGLHIALGVGLLALVAFTDRVVEKAKVMIQDKYAA